MSFNHITLKIEKRSSSFFSIIPNAVSKMCAINLS